jgi:hypothetical protein
MVLCGAIIFQGLKRDKGMPVVVNFRELGVRGTSLFPETLKEQISNKHLSVKWILEVFIVGSTRKKYLINRISG